MATLGQQTLSLVRSMLEFAEQDIFKPRSDPGIVSVSVPPSQEMLERLDFLTRLYCQCHQVVELETKLPGRLVSGIPNP